MVTYLKQIGVSECRAQTKNIIPFRVFRDGLHDGSIDDDQMFRRGLYTSAFPGIARIEKQRGALKTHPISLPASFSGKLDLVLFA